MAAITPIREDAVQRQDDDNLQNVRSRGPRSEPAHPEDLNRALWLALVAALTTFLRAARPRLGLKHGEKCPKCGHAY